jgi:hypothetical protein
MKYTTTLLLVFSCFLCGCETAPTPTFDDERRALQAQLHTIVVEDGINLQEANIIAQSYFIRFGPGCGAAADVIDGGDVWISKVFVGYAATPRESILIDKHTGRVTWKYGPTSENPKTIL